MRAPIDLSQTPARPAPPSNGLFSGNGKGTRGTGLIIDDYARRILWVALAVSVLLLGYLLAGLYTGAWSKAVLGALSHADRLRNLQNIDFVFRALQISTIIFLVCLLIVTCRDESIGYVLLVAGLIFYAGLPFLTAQIYDYRGFKTSLATQTVMADFQLLSWAFFAPGLIWVGIDLVRRFYNAAEAAAIQRANAKYGANVRKQPSKTKVRTVLSRCWELPYCRDNIRDKCPVYVKRTAPCWWYKEGCMCEERIILQAVITNDWKQKAAKADMAYNFGQQRTNLSPTALRERCRNCIIYNEHQRQKYKAMVAAALIAVPLLLWQNIGRIQVLALQTLAWTETVMKRFSLGGSPGSVPLFHSEQTAIVEWTLIGAICVILLSQVLKFIEFWCFKLKI